MKIFFYLSRECISFRVNLPSSSEVFLILAMFSSLFTDNVYIKLTRNSCNNYVLVASINNRKYISTECMRTEAWSPLVERDDGSCELKWKAVGCVYQMPTDYSQSCLTAVPVRATSPSTT